MMVVMHHDAVVNTAVCTIVANAPQVQVVDYGSLAYVLTIHRTLGRVVWVSHGSEEGILAGTGIVSWRSFGQVLDSHPGPDLVLACESEAVRLHTHSSTVVTFNTVVDAVIGGALVSYLLGFPSTSARERTGVGVGLGRGGVDVLLAGAKINPFQQAVERAARIAVGKAQPLFLSLSGLEAGFWITIAVVVTLGKLLCFNILEEPPQGYQYLVTDPPSGGWSSLERLVILLFSNFMIAGAYEIALTLLYLFNGVIDLLTAAARFVSGLVDLGGIIIETFTAWLNTLPYWEWWAYGIILVGNLITFIAEVIGSAGTGTLYKLVSILLALAPILLNLYNDSVDADPEVG